MRVRRRPASWPHPLPFPTLRASAAAPAPQAPAPARSRAAATTTMLHRRCPDHHDAPSSWSAARPRGSRNAIRRTTGTTRTAIRVPTAEKPDPDCPDPDCMAPAGAGRRSRPRIPGGHAGPKRMIYKTGPSGTRSFAIMKCLDTGIARLSTPRLCDLTTPQREPYFVPVPEPLVVWHRVDRKPHMSHANSMSGTLYLLYSLSSSGMLPQPLNSVYNWWGP